ncbi:MAG: hypothetical protein AB7V42_10495 [Thermoleophilia bacterium]
MGGTLRIPGRWWLILAVVAGLAALAPAVASAATPAPAAARTVDLGPVAARGGWAPQVALDPRGRGGVVWLARSGHLRAARVAPAGIGELPASLRPRGALTALRAGVGARGAPFAVWVRSRGGSQLWTATLGPGGGWDALTRLDAPPGGVGGLDLSTGPDGLTRIVWTEHAAPDGPPVVLTRLREPAGGWGPPALVHRAGASAVAIGRPAVLAGADGRAVVAWREQDLVAPATSRVMGATLGPGDAVGPAEVLHETAARPWGPVLAGGFPDAVAAWTDVDLAGSGRSLMATRLVAGEWAPAGRLASGAVGAPLLSREPSPSPLIAWIEGASPLRQVLAVATVDIATGAVRRVQRSRLSGSGAFALSKPGHEAATAWMGPAGGEPVVHVRVGSAAGARTLPPPGGGAASAVPFAHVALAAAAPGRVAVAWVAGAADGVPALRAAIRG